MKLLKQSWQTVLGAHSFLLGVFAIVLAFVLLSTVFIVANGQTLGPTDSHVVNLYIDGQTTTIPTRAATVREFLVKADVTLYEADLVEPSLDMPITEDNFNVQVFRARPVTIVDGGVTKRVLSPHTSARLIAQNAGFIVYDEDILTLTTTTSFVQDAIFGEKLIIDRATPVSLSLYSAPAATYRTQAKTVGEFIAERNITPESGATIVPDTSTAITSGLTIYISKFGKQVVSVEEPVNFAVQTSKDPAKRLDQITIIRSGVPGKKQVIYEIILKDGVESERRVLQEVITAQPQAQIQTVGIQPPDYSNAGLEWMRAAGIAETDLFFANYIVEKEAGWDGTQQMNASSGAYGLCQALPASKMASAGDDYMTNPVTQLKWCNSYAIARYGSWYGAYEFWRSHYWW
jgi:uncharacterized protein YabE (DUF348 family)